MEIAVLLLFAAVLIGCMAAKLSILYALAAGYVIFALYTWKQGYSFKELAAMSLSGVRTIKGMLVTFLLIGCLTAVWRASGCIPAIVCYVADILQPSLLLVLTFILCLLVSVLTGTSFGTVATMGVICVGIARAMQLPVFWIGGAVLSGAFWGDRCSPVSTSALLVSTVTGTQLYHNLRRMLRTALVPTLLACLVYLLVGLRLTGQGSDSMVVEALRSGFVIHPLCLLPAAAILLLALLRVDVKVTMIISIVLSSLLALFMQQVSWRNLLLTLVTGFRASEPALAAVINGGGILSMLSMTALVCLASTYSGIFKQTNLLNSLQGKIIALAKPCGSFLTTVFVSLLSLAVTCNQTLGIMLVQQLTHPIWRDSEEQALGLENSVVILAPLIPWCIAGSVPLATIGAPAASRLTACFLYLLPLWQIAVQMIGSKKNGRHKTVDK